MGNACASLCGGDDAPDGGHVSGYKVGPSPAGHPGGAPATVAMGSGGGYAGGGGYRGGGYASGGGYGRGGAVGLYGPGQWARHCGLAKLSARRWAPRWGGRGWWVGVSRTGGGWGSADGARVVRGSAGRGRAGTCFVLLFSSWLHAAPRPSWENRPAWARSPLMGVGVRGPAHKGNGAGRRGSFHGARPAHPCRPAPHHLPATARGRQRLNSSIPSRCRVLSTLAM